MLIHFLLLSDVIVVGLATLGQSDDVYLAVKLVTEDIEVTQGRPGKRGAIGAPGPVGPKGEVGECTCDLNELVQLRTLTSQLQASTQESDRRIGSLTEQLNSIPREPPRPELGWYTPWNGYQYFLILSSQNWQESRRLCQEKGGDLAAVGMRDFHTRNIIMNAITDDIIWIGLNDIETEGRFMWVDGVTSTRSNTHWHGSNPDNFRIEDCGHLYDKSTSFRTNDRPCSDSLKALCEKRME